MYAELGSNGSAGAHVDRELIRQVAASVWASNNGRYCGHHDGHQYFQGELIERLPRCAVTLLVGCSSGRLRDQGILDPDGYLLAYLCGGRFEAGEDGEGGQDKD